MNGTIRATALLTTLAVAIGISSAAGGAELQPLQGYAVPLGAQAATVYFRQEEGHKTLVTTIARPDFQGGPSRRVTILEPGATIAVPLTPSGILVLEAIDRGATVALDVHVDRSAGRRGVAVADAD